MGELIVFRDYGNLKFKYNKENLDVFEVLNFVQLHKKEYIIPLDDYSIDFIYKKRNQAVIYLRSEDDESEYREEFSQFFDEFKDEITFVYGDISNEQSILYAEILGLTEEDQPTLMIVDPYNLYTKYRLSQNFSYLSLKQLYLGFRNGEILPYYKSEVVPSKEYDGNVRILVGKNFEDVVYDQTKNVIVLFCTDAHSSCMNFKSDYASIAKVLANNKEIVTATIDTNKNDVKDLFITEYPTIRLYLSDNKDGIEISKEVNFENLLNFIQKNLPFAITKTKDDL